MRTSVAMVVMFLSGLHFFNRVRFFLRNRGTKISFVKNTIDLFLSLGILVLAILQIQANAKEISIDYTLYILGLLVTYVIWAKINVSRYRNKVENNRKNRHKK